MNLRDPQERIANAGEYVLGTLTPEEKRTLEAALTTDSALLREVYAWQDRLLGLTRRLSPAAVPAAIWPRVAARLQDPPARATVQAVRDRPAANDAMWSSVRFWQAVSGGALAAVVVLGVLLVSPLAERGLNGGQQVAQAPRYLAVLQSPDNAATGWVVETVGADAIRLVQVGEGAVIPQGKTMQFWTKPEGATGPTSLGLVKPGQVVTVPIRQLPGLADRTLFELTLEPAGGSPYNKPSGPILFVGKAVRL